MIFIKNYNNHKYKCSLLNVYYSSDYTTYFKHFVSFNLFLIVSLHLGNTLPTVQR